MYKSFENLRNERGLKIVTMNVQSLRNKHNYLSVVLNGLDYIGITETWLKDPIPDAYVSIPGFTIFRCDRVRGRRGGAACYVADNYAPYTEICEDFSISDPNLECLCLLTKFPGQKFRYIFTVYRPPGGVVKSCYKFLKECVGSDCVGDKEIWIIGDFNVNARSRNCIKKNELFSKKFKVKTFTFGPYILP